MSAQNVNVCDIGDDVKEVLKKFRFAKHSSNSALILKNVAMASKRKSLCIDEKVSLIRAIQAGERISHVGRRLGFSTSTVYTIWKNKDIILQAQEDGKSSKKLKKPKYEELDRAMLSWFNSQRQNNMPVSGPIVKAKAEEISEELGLTAFKASEGWLGKFKQRHHINYGKINEKAQSVDTNVTENWIDKVWPKLREKYSPNDIFNADEACIFYKLTPDKTLNFKGEMCIGGNLSNERITVFVAANMNGTEKRKLVIIGKSKNPWSLKNITQLPVTYESNRSAWMTSQLFEEELRRWDAELNGHKILLLVDNSPAHHFISNLQNIELTIFPPKMSSALQPMSHGVIENLKGHYRKKVLMELVESDGETAINMLHAVSFLSKAWEEVAATTIQQSFCRAGLCTSFVEVETAPEFESVDDLPLTEWAQHYNLPQKFSENLQSYIEVDDNLVTTALLTDEEILYSVIKTEEEPRGYEEDEMGDPEPPPSIKQALDAAKLLEKYFLCNPEPTVSQDMSKIHEKIQSKYWHSRKRQKKIRHYT